MISEMSAAEVHVMLCNVCRQLDFIEQQKQLRSLHIEALKHLSRQVSYMSTLYHDSLLGQTKRFVIVVIIIIKSDKFSML